jgi:hypothetical protein
VLIQITFMQDSELSNAEGLLVYHQCSFDRYLERVNTVLFPSPSHRKECTNIAQAFWTKKRMGLNKLGRLPVRQPCSAR